MRDDVGRRLDTLRFGGEEIDLTFRRRDSETRLEHLTRVALLGFHDRLVIVGPPGSGKSYTCLRVARDLLDLEPGRVPLVIPATQWEDETDLDTWVASRLQDAFQLSGATARRLVSEGLVVPILDGLDELAAERTGPARAVALLDNVLAWQSHGRPMRFVLAVRSSLWRTLDEVVRGHRSIQVWAVQPIRPATATEYVGSMLRPLGQAEAERITRLLASGPNATRAGTPLFRAWRLTLLTRMIALRGPAAGVSEGLLRRLSGGTSDLVLAGLFVDTVVSLQRTRWRRLLVRFDLWRLGHYARFLAENRRAARTVGGVQLSPQDIVLHRLWPIAGNLMPRVVDLLLSLVLSAPGLGWLWLYVLARGWPVRLAAAAFSAVWLAMLIRTSLKPWVPPAAPDFSRLLQPKFLLRQTVVALVIGMVVGVVATVAFGVLCFVLAWFAIGLSVGFGQTLTTDTQVANVGPSGVLRRERTVSRLAAWTLLPVVAMAFASTWTLTVGVPLAIVYCLVVGETVASAVVRRYVATWLCQPLRLWTPARLWRRAGELGLARSEGLTYRFRHEHLLDHLAASVPTTLYGALRLGPNIMVALDDEAGRISRSPRPSV